MKKLLALILVLSIVLVVPAFADQYAYVKTPTSDGTVYVRTAAGAGQPVAGVANNGDTLIILNKGNTWHKVKVLRTGIEGYMYGGYIRFIDSGSSSSGSGSSSSTVPAQESYVRDASAADTDIVVNKYGTVSSSDGYANLRWGPSTSYEVIAREYNGSTLRLYELNGSWYRCCDESGRIGYVNKKLVTLGSTLSFSTGKSGTVRSSDGYASVRSGPSSAYSQLYTLSVGQSITVYSSSGEWLRVTVPGSWTEAWIYRGLVRFSYAAKTTGNVNLRTGPGTSYSKAGVLSNGTQVTLLATDGAFCRVDTGSAIGYVSKKYLSFN